MRIHKFLICALIAVLCIPARAVTKGVLIYSDYGGAKPYPIEFEIISWKSGLIGVLKKANGPMKTFNNDTVQNILYLDGAYFQTLSRNPLLQPMRASIRNREVLVDVAPQNIRTAEDVAQVTKGITILDNLSKRYPELVTSLLPVINTLRGQTDRFARGDIKKDGIWITVADFEKQTKETAIEEQKSRKWSFSTKDGTRYENVRVSNIEVDSFSVMTDSGVSKIVFANLPENLDGVPETVKTVVANKRNEAIQMAKEAEEKKRIQSERLTKKSESKAEENNTPQIPGGKATESTKADDSTGNKSKNVNSYDITIDQILVGKCLHYSVPGIELLFTKEGGFTSTIKLPNSKILTEHGTWVATGLKTFQIRLRGDFDVSDTALFFAQLGIPARGGLIEGKVGVGFVGNDFALGEYKPSWVLNRFGSARKDAN